MKNALVLISHGIGDILMASTVFRPLKERGFFITVLCEKIGREIFEEEDWLKIVTYERKCGKPDYSVAEKELSNFTFDLGVRCIPSNLEEGLSLLNKHCEKVVVFRKEEEVRLRQMHHTIELNQMLIGEDCHPVNYHSPKILSISNIIREPTNMVAMHVGPKNWFWRYKAFNLILFRDIINWLEEGGYSPIIIGDKAQTIYGIQLLPADRVYTGQSLLDTQKLLMRCAAYVGNDSGPAHLAAALGIPTITFYGPTDRSKTGPWPLKGGNRFIQSEVECGPCWGTKRFKSCSNPICHGEVSLVDFINQWRKLEGERCLVKL